MVVRSCSSWWAASARAVAGRTRTNSSPPMRAAKPAVRSFSSRSAPATRTRAPASWESVSLICYGLLLRGRRGPVEQPAGEVDTGDRAGLVTGEEAAQPLHAAVGHDVLVPVAGQQADTERRVVRGQ